MTMAPAASRGRSDPVPGDSDIDMTTAPPTIMSAPAAAIMAPRPAEASRLDTTYATMGSMTDGPPRMDPRALASSGKNPESPPCEAAMSAPYTASSAIEAPAMAYAAIEANATRAPRQPI